MKKFKAKQELEDSVKQPLTQDQCQICGVHFFSSSIARDSHRTLYPEHFNGVPPRGVSVTKEAAATENLSGKITRRKEPKP